MDYDCRYAHLKEKIVFAALGYQNYYKGTDLLMQVWAGTAELRNNPNIALIIIGKVNDSRINLSILDGVSNAICQNRRISDEEYLYLLRHTDVYLLPYREISQSGAMLTVLSEHVPMLLSDVGSLAEPLDVAPIGWKIKSDDSDELRDALLHLTHNPDEIRRIKEDKVSWEHLRQFYDWHEISRQTESIYKKLCSF
jgi:glycosyltransferase involved in cell wall biosynthesis